jgi:Trp operon repressor
MLVHKQKQKGNIMMKDEVNSLLQKPMNRLDFLKHVGVGIAAITGAAMVVKTMNSLGNATSSKQQSVGYGSAVYGGKKDQPQQS